MKPKVIEFIVIGAARSGTTSLFVNLKAHPQIFMPLEKEVCFFSDDDRYSLDIDWYLDNYFSGVDTSKIKGEATPAYMLFTYVPERIYVTMPNVKLIAILRNPIDRAYSHYRFAKRLNLEKRGFNTAILGLLNRGAISDSKIGQQNLEYLMFGEYGRIIKEYLQFFPKKQIKILFYEDFRKNPFSVMKDVYEFLGVDSEFSSDIFKKKINASGEVRLHSLLRIQTWLKTNKRIKNFLMTTFPPRILGAIDMWLTTTGNLKPAEDSGPDIKARTLLKEYYANDVVILEQLIGIKTPWSEFTNVDK